MRYSPSDLPTINNTPYHIHLPAEELPENIILVGDPGRSDAIAARSLTDRRRYEHRGLVSNIGTTLSGLRVAVITTGMGTPSTEIVAREIEALNSVDMSTLEQLQPKKRLNIIRLGTSGALQKSTPLGTGIITRFAAGIDNAGLFYRYFQTAAELEVENTLFESLRRNLVGAERIRPYVSEGDGTVRKALQAAATELNAPTMVGTTISAPGFFAAQGRPVGPCPLLVPDLDAVLARAELSGEQQVQNFEMEAAHLFRFFGAMNQAFARTSYRAGTICLAVANRREDTFDTNYSENMDRLTDVVLKAFELLQ